MLIFHMVRTIICGVVLSALPSFAIADEAFCPSVVEVGITTTVNRAKSVWVIDETAFVADGVAGLQVYDISDATNPQRIGGMDTDGRAIDVIVVGDICFVADGSGGLDLFDVSDPAAPLHLDELDLGGAVNRIEVDGLFLYADVGSSVGYRALQIFEISNPAQPVFISAYEDVCEVNDIAVASGRGVIVCDDADSILLDLSTQSDPRFIRRISNSRGVESADAVGNLLVLAYASAMSIYDVSDDDMLVELYSYQGGTSVRSARVWDEQRVVFMTEEEIIGIDIADPARPLLLFNEPITGDGLRVAGGGDRVCAALNGDGIISLDTSGLRSPVVETLPMPGLTLSIAEGNGYAFLGLGQDGIAVLDTRNPEAPVEVGSVGTGGAVIDLYLQGSTLYAASNTVLEIIDVSNPMNPSIVFSMPTPQFSTKVQAANGLVYVLSEDRRLDVIDASDPSMPQIVGDYSFPGDPFSFVLDLVVDGEFAYVAADLEGLIVLDISDTDAIEEVSRTELPPDAGIPSAYAVQMHAERLLVSTRWFGTHLSVVDIADPQNPTIVSTIDTGTDALVLDGDVGYGASGGLRVFDFSNPDQPVQTQFLDMLAPTPDLALIGETIYLCSSSHGVRIIDVAGCGLCPADLNGDGLLNFFDVSTFLVGYLGQDASGDWNGDGEWDFFDVSAFLGDYTLGCP